MSYFGNCLARVVLIIFSLYIIGVVGNYWYEWRKKSESAKDQTEIIKETPDLEQPSEPAPKVVGEKTIEAEVWHYIPIEEIEHKTGRIETIRIRIYDDGSAYLIGASDLFGGQVMYSSKPGCEYECSDGKNTIYAW